MSKPIWPKVPSGFVRAVLAGHSALGLAFAALIYLVCFSGSVAVFAEEFHRWERPAAPQMKEASPQAVQTLLSQAIAKAPGAEHVFIYAKIADFLPEVRELFREPDFLIHLEDLVRTLPDFESKMESRKRLIAIWTKPSAAE